MNLCKWEKSMQEIINKKDKILEGCKWNFLWMWCACVNVCGGEECSWLQPGGNISAAAVSPEGRESLKTGSALFLMPSLSSHNSLSLYHRNWKQLSRPPIKDLPGRLKSLLGWTVFKSIWRLIMTSDLVPQVHYLPFTFRDIGLQPEVTVSFYFSYL